jgi:hypothetical protein
MDCSAGAHRDDVLLHPDDLIVIEHTIALSASNCAEVPMPNRIKLTQDVIPVPGAVVPTPVHPCTGTEGMGGQ